MVPNPIHFRHSEEKASNFSGHDKAKYKKESVGANSIRINLIIYNFPIRGKCVQYDIKLLYNYRALRQCNNLGDGW